MANYKPISLLTEHSNMFQKVMPKSNASLKLLPVECMIIIL